jgi:hypothetical protein
MSLNLKQIRSVDRELSADIELTVQMQSRIRLRFAVADPAELEWLRNFDHKLSAEIDSPSNSVDSSNRVWQLPKLSSPERSRASLSGTSGCRNNYRFTA